MFDSKNEIDVLNFISKSKELSDAFVYYLYNNKSISSPYHNIDHVMTMISMIIDCKGYRFQDTETFSEQDWNDIVVATIFHDFNHSAGRYDDKINIINAKEAYITYCTSKNMKCKHIICDLIDATQYPYIDNAHTSMQFFMREIDVLSGIYHNHYFTHTFIGLRTELRKEDIRDCIDNTMLFNEMITQDFKFMYSKHIVDSYKEGMNSNDVFETLERILSWQ